MDYEIQWPAGDAGNKGVGITGTIGGLRFGRYSIS
jgi:hypothetical protein